MKKAKPVQAMDERQQQISAKSILVGLIFLAICVFAGGMYRQITTGESGWEIFALIGTGAAIVISRPFFGDVEQPLDYKNRPLPTGSSKKERITRCKNYAVHAAIFGLTFAVMDILLIGVGEYNSDYDLAQIIFPSLSKGATVAATAAIAFVSMFAIDFVFAYLIYEYIKVKRYNRMIARLDAEEFDEE